MKAIDLFCGTGGFSRGAQDTTFEIVAAFDIDPNLTSSHKYNFPDVKLYLKDVSDLTEEWLRENISSEIDLVYGGPPCQGFSMIGKRDADDDRRTLLDHFFRVVSILKPAAFVMENVEGLLYTEAKEVLDHALRWVEDGYTVLKPKVFDASEFGAATKRRRAFVVGYDPDRCGPIDWSDFEAMKAPATTVQQALAGLKGPKKLDETEDGFDLWRIRGNAAISKYALKLQSEDRTFTGNRRTKHLPRVVRRFSKIEQGGFDPIGKYPRLKWAGQCPTLRAGTGADHGSHQAVRPIHPDEHRVITVREAARLQGFPDDHRFNPTIWHSFRQVGNSVSPIIAKAILSVVYEKLSEEVNEETEVLAAE